MVRTSLETLVVTDATMLIPIRNIPLGVCRIILGSENHQTLRADIVQLPSPIVLRIAEDGFFTIFAINPSHYASAPQDSQIITPRSSL